MMIFPESDLIFFAIPKTGSTAFEQTFKRDIASAVVLAQDRKHMNVRQFEKNNPDPRTAGPARQMARMAILREPLARLDSWYRYRARLEGTNPVSTKGISFEEFIEATLLTAPPAFASNVGDQWTFCSRKNGELGVHHLFDIARLQPLDGFLQARLGRRFPRQRFNESIAKKIILSKSVENRLREYRHQEFALYESVVKNAGHLFTDLPG